MEKRNITIPAIVLIFAASIGLALIFREPIENILSLIFQKLKLIFSQI